MEKIVVKFEINSKELVDLQKELQTTGKLSEQTVQKFIEIQKVTTKADEGFKSLKQQIRETKEEAQKMAQQFGENSKQATQAAQKVANLTEDLDDFNKKVAALNPEAKFNALQTTLQGTLGAFQGLTGAVQLFGGESKRAEEIAKKMQGALNFAMGLNSLLSLKDAFGNLKLILTTATASQQALTVATTEGAVATEGATVATKGFTAAIASNPLGAFLVALTAVAVGMAIFSSETADNTEEIKKNTEALKQQEEERSKIIDDLEKDSKKRRQTIEDLQIELDKVSGKINERQAELLRLNAEEQRQIEEFTSKGFLNTLDQVKVDRIKQEFALRRKILETEIAKEQRDSTKFKLMARIEINKEELLKSIKASNDEFRTNGLDGTMVEVPYKAVPLNKDIIRRDLFDLFVDDINTVLPLYQEFSNSIVEINRNQTDARLMDLEEQKNAGILSETQYQQKVRELKRKASKEDKEMAVFQASIGIASAIINALNTKPPSAVPFAVASASAIGAFQLAAILSRPLPKFNSGKLPQFAGQYTGGDNQLAWVASEEAIIPALKTRAYYPALDAIYKGSISPKDFNDFVKGKTKGNKTDLRATINPYDLSRAMNNRKVKIANSSELARSIAYELTGQYSARRA